MKLIKKEKFIEVFKTSIFDYCLILPIIESNNMDKIECYVCRPYTIINMRMVYMTKYANT